MMNGRLGRQLAVLGGGLIAGACIVPQTAYDVTTPATQLVATIGAVPGGTLGGSVTLLRGEAPDRTRVVVWLHGAVANAVYSWHVHDGRCDGGAPAAIVGDPAIYPSLPVGSGGSVRVVAELPFGVDVRKPHFVHIHETAARMGAVAGCGDFELQPLNVTLRQ